MIYVSERYALVIAIIDLTMLTTALVFRKQKPKPRTSTLGPKQSRLLGYYIIGAGVFTLLLGHYAFYMSLANYLEGLFLDAFLIIHFFITLTFTSIFSFLNFFFF